MRAMEFYKPSLFICLFEVLLNILRLSCVSFCHEVVHSDNKKIQNCQEYVTNACKMPDLSIEFKYHVHNCCANRANDDFKYSLMTLFSFWIEVPSPKRGSSYYMML